MFSRLAFRLTSFVLLTFCARPGVAQEFSADMVRLKPEGAAGSKVFVRGDRMRLEIAGQPQGHGALVLVDLKESTGFMVLPDNNSYTPLPSGSVTASIPFFHPADPENACAAWEKAVSKPGSCTKVGPETISGRDTIKYKGMAGNGDTGYAWLDRKLNFVIEWQGEKGAAELQNIQEGPQAATLFEIPKSYEKIDPQAEHDKRVKARANASAPKPQN